MNPSKNKMKVLSKFAMEVLFYIVLFGSLLLMLMGILTAFLQ